MRSLPPLIALIALFTLPQALPDDRPAKPPADKPAAEATPPAPVVFPVRTQVVRVRHASAPAIQNNLFQLFPRVGTPAERLVVTCDPATNALVLSGSEATIASAMAVIEELDIEASADARPVRVVALQHARAEKLADLIEQAIGQARLGSLITSQPGVAFDSRTNALLVMATDAEFAVLEPLIARLDQPGGPPPAPDRDFVTRLRLDIYHVAVPRAQAAAIDTDALAAEKTPADTMHSLQKLGPTRHLYRIDQPVDLPAQPKFRFSANTPVAATGAASTSKNASRAPSPEIACSVGLAGRWEGNAVARGRAAVEIDVFDYVESGGAKDGDTAALLFTRVPLRFDGPVTSGKPVALLSLIAGRPGESVDAYVAVFAFDRREL